VTSIASLSLSIARRVASSMKLRRIAAMLGIPLGVRSLRLRALEIWVRQIALMSLIRSAIRRGSSPSDGRIAADCPRIAEAGFEWAGWCRHRR
jgi:hypothetical protein